ncbi:MAG TPA: glutathionylspermidine synthase family protein [Gemmatimonadaceae bacterium]|nr:glutathionylspermidine synthase family protein [Gemmatimonadaceae bacterium]
MREIRADLVLNHCKWDPQVGDRSTLFAQPLLLDATAWRDLSHWSELLGAEISQAEAELSRRPDLQQELGLPHSLRRVLTRGTQEGFTPSAVRVMRFDFHLTTDGWRVSEVNSDVPGGFTEASRFTQLMARQYPRARVAGDPLAEWTRLMLLVARRDGAVAFLSAAGYLEDQQVTALLASALCQHGIDVRLLHRPGQLKWRSGFAQLAACGTPVSAIVRFYQGEWICQLKRSAWEGLFIGGGTPVSNHGLAVLTESKRLPLLWDSLETDMKTCRALFAASGNPRDLTWQASDDWVVKAAFCCTGDSVAMRDRSSRAQWAKLCHEVSRRSERWVLQRRFSTVPVDSAVGPVFPCVGVYVLNGKVAGAYARVATDQVVDHRAMDAALLVVDANAA